MGLVTPSGGLLFWMVVIFGVVFFLLAKFGFPVITSMVRKRKDFITTSLQEAQQARARAEGAEETCRKMIEEARRQQNLLLEQARASARQAIEEAREQASAEAAEILVKARADIEQEKREALAQLQNVVAGLSVAVSEKILRDTLSDDKAQADYVEKVVEEFRRKDTN